MISDIPPQMPLPDAQIMCSVEAAQRYDLPIDLVFAIAKTEGGKPGLRVKNTNKTEDLGLLQFNTAYIKELSEFGIKEDDVLASTCYPFHLAAWRIATHLKEPVSGDMWTRASLYHSRTPKYRDKYREKLINAASLLDWEKAYKYKKILISKQIAVLKEKNNKEQVSVLKPVIGDFTKAVLALESSDLVIIPAREELRWF